MAKWTVKRKGADFKAWSERYGISPITARLIRNRGIVREEDVEKYIKGSVLDLYPPELLADMEDAAQMIGEQIALHRKIRVIGDYDVDGVTSTTILLKGLRALGATVDTVIPHRIKDGYGLNDQLILDAEADGIDMIVTCDNGIAAAPQIELANSKGMTVVVTDHHEVPFVTEGDVRRELLPPAAAVVDPKREDDESPFSGICGAVVAYKLITLMLRRSQRIAIEEKNRLNNELLQLAALGTVCDVMELKDENRVLVQLGLKLMRTEPCTGVKALMQVNSIAPASLNAYHLGFVLGPCINATGRLDTAGRALELLDSTDERQAMVNAGELKLLNESRKTMTSEGVDKAIAYLEDNSMAGDKVLVVFLPDVHESLAGIIAGRIREKYERPTLVLTRGEEGVKGSGRSVEGYDMFTELSACKELFDKFGGHKMAAGLSLPEENVEILRERLNRACTMTEEDFEETLSIDMEMPFSYATMELCRETAILEPFGMGNPKPLYVTRNVRVTGAKLFGKEQDSLRLFVTQDGFRTELMYFRRAADFEKAVNEKYGEGTFGKLRGGLIEITLSVVYEPGINEFRGEENLQIIMRDYKFS